MALLVPDVGEVAALKYLVNKAAQGNVKLKLYTNNVTPAEGDTHSTYTESTATGYAAKTLTGASWTVGTSGGTSTASYAEQTFTYTAAETVYGYYVVDNAGTTLLWAEKFSAVFNIPAGGGDIRVTPTISAS